MEEKSEFYKKISKNIEEQKEKIPSKDYKFYLVDRFEKFAYLIDLQSGNCIECNSFKKEILETSSNLSELLIRSKTNKIKYEKVNDKIYNHLSKVHGFWPKRYFASYYSVLGMAVGLIFGLFLSYVIYYSFSKIILFALLAGFLTGNFLGYKKDQKLKKKKLQF